MRRIDCPHETDVLDAVYTRRWPARVDADLRAHVAHCDICTDVVAVAQAFEGEPSPEVGQARLPDAGLIWWKAQLRARDDARRVAGRPITVAQAVAFASFLGVAGAVFGATSHWLQGWLRTVRNFFAAVEIPRVSLPDSVTTTIAEHGVLAIFLGACLLILSLAVVLIVQRE